MSEHQANVGREDYSEGRDNLNGDKNDCSVGSNLRFPALGSEIVEIEED